ncbi:THOP1 [Cordylochernes scorpioides]|uniref:THOP1 n=1 Tax=Cordylochernes scorpioides TaxID=51811 RepID=A0ABY6KFK3_9ARAC|nr:THOP1 [Cordylochernes scorpioides]
MNGVVLGLHLPQTVQDEIRNLKFRINELSIQFHKNLNEDSTKLDLAEQELEGLPSEFIHSLELQEDGKRVVTLKYPHYFPIMRKAKNPATRQRLEHAFDSQCIKENTPILEELVSLRQKAYGKHALSIKSCEYLFRRFKSGDFDTRDKERGERPIKFEDAELEALLDEDSSQTQEKLAEALGVTQQAISNRLKVMGMVQKQGNWVPYELKPGNIERRICTCELLLKRQNRKGFLHRIMTGDKKWIHYDNPKRRKSWVKPGHASTSTAKPNIHGKKLMLCIWWDQLGVIYYELLQPNETITGERYQQQLMRLSRALKIKRPLYAKRHDKQAELLGFPTHAAYITDLRMAKSPEKVRNFLTELASKLAPMWKKEEAYLLELKEKDCKELGLEYDGKLNMYDLRYYTTKVEEIQFSVDQNQLRKYFPLQALTQRLLDIYQVWCRTAQKESMSCPCQEGLGDLLNIPQIVCSRGGVWQLVLGLQFAEQEGAEVWHPDVRMFSVSDSTSGELLGYFFMDLFPREGKYNHAAMFELQPGCLLPDGSRQVAVAALVANFTNLDDKPLLDHTEVTTFFHEFGHVMHQICAQAKLSHFNGTNVERDFIEAPSQMLENWCWEAESLRWMSCHHEDNSPIPESLLEPLIRSRLANCAYHNIRQIVLALFDLEIHTRGQADTQKLFAEIHQKYLNIAPSPGTNFAAHFGHLACGYDAQYYGYMWSEVYSADMFYSRFKKENGVLSSELGREYRSKILMPGGSKDGLDMLLSFLGREPNQEAFLISKGLLASH